MLADDLWKQGYEIGLGTHLAGVLSCFPADSRTLLGLASNLASAGQNSADHVFHCLEKMEIFAEPAERVPSDHIQMKGTEQFSLVTHRCPSEFCSAVVLRSGTVGIIDGGLFKWQASYDGWQFLLAEVDLLAGQVSTGSQNVCPSTMANVLAFLHLCEQLFLSSPLALQRLGRRVSDALLILTERFAHIANPPVDLISSALRVLSVVALERPKLLWDGLAKSGLFPHSARAVLGGGGGLGLLHSDISSGLVGFLLAQVETGNGEFPLMTAFLDLLLRCVQADEARDETFTGHHASIVYLALDILPSYQQWRFANAVEKEIFGQKLLRIFREVLAHPKTALSEVLRDCLRQPAASQTLLQLVGTGDRVVQSLLEAQSSWESGVGKELAELVSLAMTVFEQLLSQSSLDCLDDLNRHLCSPAPGGKPHFVLSVAHYVYHVYDCDIPVAAIRLLGTIARMFPMSLRSCLGDNADAVRDLLIFRLASFTDNVKLKIACVDFFSACVDAQPAFIQLLIGTTDELIVKHAGKEAAGSKDDQDKKKKEEEAKAQNDKVKLVSDSGCLTPVLRLLKESKEFDEANEDLAKLHLSLTLFILHLWSQQRVVAMEHLKRQEDFWSGLTWTLFDSRKRGKKTKLNACVLRILASEIYTYGGEVDSALKAILDKFCDSKNPHLSDWCDLVLGHLKDEEVGDETIVGSSPASDGPSDYVALLGAWKAFLIILSKDQPVTVVPSQCHVVAASLIRAIRLQLASSSDRSESAARVVTSMSEVCLVLMQRWQTKCADNMEEWCREQLLLLEELSVSFDELHPRSRSALLAIVNTALRTSSFKLDKEEEVLAQWLDPAADIVLKAFYHFENGKRAAKKQEDKDKDGQHPQQVPILALSLLRNLIQRFSDGHSGAWFPVLHRKVQKKYKKSTKLVEGGRSQWLEQRDFFHFLKILNVTSV